MSLEILSPNDEREHPESQRQLYNNLIDHLSQVEALLHVALDENFLAHEKYIIHNYLCAMDTFIKQAHNISHQLYPI